MVIQHEESVINLGHVLYGVRFRAAVLLSSPPPSAPLLCTPLLSASPSRRGDSRSVMRFAPNKAGTLATRTLPGASRPNFGHMPLAFSLPIPWLDNPHLSTARHSHHRLLALPAGGWQMVTDHSRAGARFHVKTKRFLNRMLRKLCEATTCHLPGGGPRRESATRYSASAFLLPNQERKGSCNGS